VCASSPFCSRLRIVLGVLSRLLDEFPVEAHVPNVARVLCASFGACPATWPSRARSRSCLFAAALSLVGVCKQALTHRYTAAQETHRTEAASISGCASWHSTDHERGCACGGGEELTADSGGGGYGWDYGADEGGRYDTPLVADIHFAPKVAMRVAEAFEKIRVNPGNFVDGRKKFDEITFESDADYKAEVRPSLHLTSLHATSHEYCTVLCCPPDTIPQTRTHVSTSVCRWVGAHYRLRAVCEQGVG